MFKNHRTYYYVLAVLVLLYMAVELLKPQPIDWTESFSAGHDIPYGSALLYKLLPAAFSGDIEQNQQPLLSALQAGKEAPRNWIFVNTSFEPDQWETEQLLNHVKQGAQIFVAARSFRGAFADSLNIQTSFQNPLLGEGAVFGDDTARVHFTNPRLQREGGYPFLSSTTQTHFSQVDSAHAVLLGINQSEKAIFIGMKRGEGHLYLHANPTLFTNYFVRTKAGADYALTALSYLPDAPVIWDEYHKLIYRARGSGLRYILSQQYLHYAWVVTLVGILLFMLFRSKRRQRIIPVIEPPKNSTLEFARTLGRLYLQEGSHRQMALTKIRHFREYLHHNLDVQVHEFDSDKVESVAMRSGLEPEIVAGIFKQISDIYGKDDITPKKLKSITEAIDNFYKNSAR